MFARVICACCLMVVGFSSSVSAENWPQFRGADGSGVSPTKGLPTQWSASDYAWNVELPGEGHAAPVIWNDALFITTATDDGQLRHLLRLDPATGRMQWARSVGFNSNRKHQKNSFASSTPATDGERVYVAFADQERYALAAYDFDGELQWRTWLGPFSSQHGLGASPIVFEDLVILANDQDGPSSIVALDRRDGRLVWSTLRAFREASYATPLVYDPANGKRPQLICVSGAMGISSLDPWTGEANWQTEPLPQRTVASPVIAGGRIFATCGQGGKGTQMIGVDPQVIQDGQATVSFRRLRALPYVPCMIGHGDLLYMWNDNGVVACLDPKTEKMLWEERIGGNYSGSPLCVGGRLYALEESGLVKVVAASPEFQEFPGGDLGDPSHSTPAVANGRLFLRSFHRLACLAAPASTGSR